MIDRFKNLFKPDDDPEPGSRLEELLKDLDYAIASVTRQYSKISRQEKELNESLSEYRAQHAEKISQAKAAFRAGDELKAESLFEESELINLQISQYTGIVRNIHQTGQQLLSRKNQFRFTRDQLKTRHSLGEANLDASQLHADLSEQLLILDETGELSRFDDLITEASSKSAAIDEIRGSESLMEEITNPVAEASTNKVKQLVQEENNRKLRASQQNQQILIEQVFGKLTPSVDTALAENKKTLLEKLKDHNDNADGKEKNVSRFFEKESSMQKSEDQNDRINNFFDEKEQLRKNHKESIINQFFRKK